MDSQLTGDFQAARDGVPVLRIENLSKTFPGTRALSEVSLEIGRGDIHALVGQNGSGKSTLIKVLSGFHHPDPGARAWLDGEPYDLDDPVAEESREALRFVHQELGLILELGAADNLALLGQFRYHGGIGPWPGPVDWREQKRVARETLARFGVDIDVDAPLSEASPVERTVVAISAALRGWEGGSGVLVLDEPTAVLPPHEVARLHEIVREVRRGGTSVLYVSHRLDELFGLADKVSVLRGGRLVATRDIAELDKARLASLMVGEKVDLDYRTTTVVPDSSPVVCEARDLRSRELDGVDLTVRRGEVIGVAGLPGSGLRDLAYLFSGALGRHCDGWIRMNPDSEEWIPASQAGSFAVPLVPADRGTEASIDAFSVKENLSLRVLNRLRRGPAVSAAEEDAICDSWSEQVAIKAGSMDDPIGTLSGGNQQKVIVARCLAADPGMIAMCEPTAGVDAGTRRALHGFIAEQAAAGLAVIVSSTDISDLLGMCNRVVVLADGKVVRSIGQQDLSEEVLIDAMEGS